MYLIVFNDGLTPRQWYFVGWEVDVSLARYMGYSVRFISDGL